MSSRQLVIMSVIKPVILFLISMTNLISRCIEEYCELAETEEWGLCGWLTTAAWRLEVWQE